MAGGGGLCYSIDDGRVAKVMMTAGRLLQYRWRRSDRGVDDGMDTQNRRRAGCSID